MKKLLVVLAAMMMVIFMVSVAMATDLAPAPKVDVSATVASKCVQIADGTLTFTIDPSVNAAATPSVNTAPKVQCSNKKTVAVSVASVNNGTPDS
jgi:spore coat protein U-like protein